MKCRGFGFVFISGGISEVVKLLNTESLLLKEAATLALSTLTHTNQLNAL